MAVVLVTVDLPLLAALEAEILIGARPRLDEHEIALNKKNFPKPDDLDERIYRYYIEHIRHVKGLRSAAASTTKHNNK